MTDPSKKTLTADSKTSSGTNPRDTSTSHTKKQSTTRLDAHAIAARETNVPTEKHDPMKQFIETHEKAETPKTTPTTEVEKTQRELSEHLRKKSNAIIAGKKGEGTKPTADPKGLGPTTQAQRQLPRCHKK